MAGVEMRNGKAGLVLLVSIGAISVLIYWLLLPLLRLSDPAWVESHTEAACWLQTRHAINRVGLRMSSGYLHYAARNGDKKLFAKILEDTRNDGDLESSLLGNRATVLASIANHDFGSDLVAWQKWWNLNKGLSQQEWIMKGFAARGIQISLPLTKQDAWVLLRIANNNPPSSLGSNEVPQYIAWNAFRLLRDCEISPINLSDEAQSTDDWKALLRYQAMRFAF